MKGRREELRVLDRELQAEIEGRRSAEEERAFFASLIRNSQDAIIAFDLEGSVTFWNPAAETLLGYETRDAIGMPIQTIMASNNGLAWPQLRDALHGCAGATHLEASLQHREGAQLDVSLSISPICDTAGQTIGGCKIVRDIGPQKLAEREIRSSLEEKVLLLREIHHRVKNNMQIVSSLLKLQSLRLGDPAARAALEESHHRVRSMAMVHEKLYHSDSLAEVNFTEYVRELTGDLIQACISDGKRVETNFDLQPVDLSIDQAIPAGLVLNELVTNGLKHGVAEGSSGSIAVHLECSDDGEVTLTVSDSGSGLPPGIDLARPKTLGLQLVKTLTDQLHGVVHCQHEHGLQFTVRFPKDVRARRGFHAGAGENSDL